MKWALLGNAIFMLGWLGLRDLAGHPFSWLILDAALVVGSLLIADRYRDAGF